jgi:hypothetical protein
MACVVRVTMGVVVGGTGVALGAAVGVCADTKTAAQMMMMMARNMFFTRFSVWGIFEFLVVLNNLRRSGVS